MVNHKNNITLIFNNIIQIVEYLIKYDKEKYDENKKHWKSELRNIFIQPRGLIKNSDEFKIVEYHCTIKKIINLAIHISENDQINKEKNNQLNKIITKEEEKYISKIIPNYTYKKLNSYFKK